jgi:protein dithiol oxidoreductase (disulfide-forming)
MLKRTWFAWLLLAFALSAFGQARLVPGKDYVELSPAQPVETGDKIEVVEFFWYRCPHCYSLEPYLDGWMKKLPADTQFRRVPAVFSDEWAVDARIFYALEAIGQEERVRKGLFDAIHKGGGTNVRGQAYMKFVADHLAKQGVDMPKYEAALRSFAVESNLKRAIHASQAYRLEGVPTLVVQGRYVVSATAVADRQGMIDITDRLIAEARRNKVAKK